ncbi:MAG: fructose PTS transporter subunit IIB [Acholeplasmataceae bacterium]|nr:fructose PTS transporter subunit IIB [Acholeplasmataceae bacterium]
MPKIVCVTACPTGIAHTYIAAEMLKVAGKSLGYEMLIETHGAIGVENKLKSEDIKESIGVIIASDLLLDLDRFKDKKIVEISTSQAIGQAMQWINHLINLT